jgi:predicted Zn-dependent peptidase
LKGSYLLAQEGTSSRMNALGKNGAAARQAVQRRGYLRRIEGVTLDDIRRILPKVLDVKTCTIVCVGRVISVKRKCATF